MLGDSRALDKVVSGDKRSVWPGAGAADEQSFALERGQGGCARGPA